LRPEAKLVEHRNYLRNVPHPQDVLGLRAAVVVQLLVAEAQLT